MRKRCHNQGYGGITGSTQGALLWRMLFNIQYLKFCLFEAIWKKCSSQKRNESIISEWRVPERAGNKNVKTKETDYSTQFLHFVVWSLTVHCSLVLGKLFQTHFFICKMEITLLYRVTVGQRSWLCEVFNQMLIQSKWPTNSWDWRNTNDQSQLLNNHSIFLTSTKICPLGKALYYQQQRSTETFEYWVLYYTEYFVCIFHLFIYSKDFRHKQTREWGAW